MPMKAPLIEVFTSIQGEGPYVGYRHRFVRFAGCNLSCDYCDTSSTAGPRCRIEKNPGKQDYFWAPNPVTVDALLAWTADAVAPRHHALALTGGEPLLYPDFLEAFLTRFRDFGTLCYLETNGTLPKAMARLARLVDIVAMDVKLSSVTGYPCPEAVHRAFLHAVSPARVFVKAVVGRDTSDAELDGVCALIADVAEKTPLVLQPVTPGSKRTAPPAKRLLEMQERCLNQLSEVRVIPQAHRLLGVP